MKGMILAAGYGTRLGLLGQQLPKPMLPVMNVPLITYVIDSFKKAGIKDVVINQHHLGDKLQNFLKNGENAGVNISWSLEDGDILGTGGGVKNALHLLGDGPFVVSNGKIIFDLDLMKVLDFHKKGGFLATMVLRRDPNASKWGSIGFDNNGKIISILGKNSDSQETCSSDYMFTGIQILEKDFFDIMPNGPACLVRDGYIKHFNAKAHLGAYNMENNYWFEHSTPERYLTGCMNILKMGPSNPFSSVFNNHGNFIKVQDSWSFIHKTAYSESSWGKMVIAGSSSSIYGSQTPSDLVIWENSNGENPIRNSIITPLGLVEATDGNNTGFTGPALKK